MVVQHNMQAANASRMLNITTSQQGKTTEKLSSGYRINRAADDAAGLSISEKMRRQIRGLSQASTNASDGVSAVQTAEGALNEVHDMLQRMNELAVQASNGTYSESDREDIQNEIVQLTDEIDRISQTTRFNESYLLKGNGNKSKHLINAHDAGLEGTLNADASTKTTTFSLTDIPKAGDTITIAAKNYVVGETLNTSSYATTTAAGDLPIAAGDSITVATETGSHTLTVTDDVSENYMKTITFKVGDMIKDADGVLYKCTVGGTGIDGAGISRWENTTNDKEVSPKELFVTGNQVKFVSSTDSASKWRDIVEKQDGSIISTLEMKNTGGYDEADLTVKNVLLFANGNTKGKAIGTHDVAAANQKGLPDAYAALLSGSSVTLSGNTVYVTDNHFINRYNDIVNTISSLQAGNAVVIKDELGKNAVIYTVVPEQKNESEVDNELTRESIIEKIKEGYEVELYKSYTKATDTLGAVLDYFPDEAGNANATNKATVAGAETADDDTKSVSEIYAMMAAELQKASNIGADEDTQASVVNYNNGTFLIHQAQAEYSDPYQFNLHVGAEADMTNKIVVDIQSLSAVSLGVKGVTIADDTGINATYAIDVIADALQKVSNQRAELGAVQNRLEHSIANLDNVVENTEASESRIRDTDMADEMVKYSKNNILAQAGQSMLAQANQATQGVLSLLQ